MQEAPAIRTVTDPRLLDAVAAYFGRPAVRGPLEALRGLRRDRVAACRDCPHADRCGAGCMGRAFAAFGDAFAVEDRCRLRQTVYRQASFQR